jgi:RNA polymerase sigma-70 factor (ECF subfamily)
MNGDSESASSATSLSLLAAARAQDQRAWERLALLYEPLIHEWCRRSQVSTTDALDIAQDVLGAVWKGLGEFRKERPQDTFRGWLRTITRNKIRDHFRRRKQQATAVGGSAAQQQFQEVPDLLADDTAEVSLADDRIVCNRALELVRVEFEPATWAAFWKTVVDGQSAVDAAESLGVSAGSVRQSKYKVLRRLRCELGDLLSHPIAAAENV